MAKGKLYEYAVLFHPKAKKDVAGNEEPVKSKIITHLTRILASDDNEVAMLAARSIPEEYTDKLDMVEIIIRPF